MSRTLYQYEDEKMSVVWT